MDHGSIDRWMGGCQDGEEKRREERDERADSWRVDGRMTQLKYKLIIC